MGFIASTLLFLPNRLPLMLSIPVLAFLAGYSFAKRFTMLAHFWLGTALALSPIAAWIAIRGAIVLATPSDLLPAVALGGAVHHLGRRLRHHLRLPGLRCRCRGRPLQHSRLASAFRAPPTRRLRATQPQLYSLASLPLSIRRSAGCTSQPVAAVAALLVYEHVLVRPDDLSRVNAAFFNVNAIISIGLFLAGSLDLLIHHVGY